MPENIGAFSVHSWLAYGWVTPGWVTPGLAYGWVTPGWPMAPGWPMVSVHMVTPGWPVVGVNASVTLRVDHFRQPPRFWLGEPFSDGRRILLLHSQS